jgi:DNA-binding transcriptional LysR family regulator
LWAAEGISPEVVFEAMEIPTIEGLVAAGLGIAVVPTPPRPNRAEPAAVYIPLSNPSARRAVGMAWVNGRPISPAADRFAAFIRAQQPRSA